MHIRLLTKVRFNFSGRTFSSQNLNLKKLTPQQIYDNGFQAGLQAGKIIEEQRLKEKCGYWKGFEAGKEAGKQEVAGRNHDQGYIQGLVEGSVHRFS